MLIAHEIFVDCLGGNAMKSKHRRFPGLWDRTVIGGDEYYVNKSTCVRYYTGGFANRSF